MELEIEFFESGDNALHKYKVTKGNVAFDNHTWYNYEIDLHPDYGRYSKTAKTKFAYNSRFTILRGNLSPTYLYANLTFRQRAILKYMRGMYWFQKDLLMKATLIAQISIAPLTAWQLWLYLHIDKQEQRIEYIQGRQNKRFDSIVDIIELNKLQLERWQLNMIAKKDTAPVKKIK